MKEPGTALQYGDRESRAVRSVLVELGQVLGAWRDKFVIVGGSVPWLLLDGAEPPHIGTIDVDIGLDPEALSGGEYASFIETLEKKGYERDTSDLKPFQLKRTVHIDDGEPIAVLVDLLMPREAKGDRNKKKLVKGLRVQRADGCGIALDHCVTLRFEGIMPDGRKNSVDLRIATIPALLTMKGYALAGRDKLKDAYDIYYSVKHYPEGISALATACKPLMDDATARAGFEKIADKFRDRDDYGPVTVRSFLIDSEAAGTMDPDQIQTDAYEKVASVLSILGLRK